MATKKIPDYFGEYIGGARRDEWRIAGLSPADIAKMNDKELAKYVTRDCVWPLPSAIKAVESGTPTFIAYWQRVIRRLTYSHPMVMIGETIEDKSQRYVEAIRELRTHVEMVRDEADLMDFYQYVNNDPPIENCIGIYGLKRTQHLIPRLKQNCANSNFPYFKRKSGKRKKAFIPPQLDHIEREGTDYREGIHVTPEIWQNTFAFRGVEFGNWTSQKDRQYSLDYAFDALKDLAFALGVEDTDLAFGGKLALAFGSRGRSYASAHYESEREVINLTKMHGAGCTAHEWFHAFDDALAKFYGVTDGLASENLDSGKLPPTFVNLITALKEDAEGNPTDFYRGSKRFDKKFARDGFGYWTSNCEMAARAFACYVKDVLGYKSDYLIAHADVYVFEFDDQSISAIPQGEEREILDELFDQLFGELLYAGFFHERTEASEQGILTEPDLSVEQGFVCRRHFNAKLGLPDTEVKETEPMIVSIPGDGMVQLYPDTDGQFSFLDLNTEFVG